MSETTKLNGKLKMIKRSKKSKGKKLVIGNSACLSSNIESSESLGDTSEDLRCRRLGELLGVVYDSVSVPDMVKLLNLNVIGLQESKSECIDASLVNSIWGSDSNEFVYGPSIRASGGTHLIWDPIVFQKELVLSGANFSGVVGRWHVRVQQERVGCFFFISEATTFNDFIAKSGLLDFQMGNHRFTRFNREGTKMSKLDRFLVSQNFFNFWNNASVLALPRTLSDHCPVLLSVGIKHSGPKAFKIFDHWFSVPGFDSLINNSWSEGLYNGTPDIILKNKLKKLKADIKEWNYSNRVESNRLKEESKKRIFEWDQKAELGSLLPNDVDAMEELLIELMHLDQTDRNSLKQKSRVKWAIEGDENTKFFHTLVNKKERKQAINGLIWNEAVDATFLEASISMDEMKEVVWSCSWSKSPGPDGILARGCNPSFIVLVPKINDPLHMSDYCPINRDSLPTLSSIMLKAEDSRLCFLNSRFLEKAFDSVLTGHFSHDIMQQMDLCSVAWPPGLKKHENRIRVGGGVVIELGMLIDPYHD
ncbi:RNA-directed DNA polymerase, eukaryota [Tanacetum coccineum]